ncbi:MAG: hypothetical protein QOE54_5328 [Streptosporangiaceae bacterium]|jgi:uncharacterized membrane protein (TIGR02234 family)|nr:major facilitator superfamily transporter [Streptosporangiaceae bacterium]MDX6432962.1 hypothetical protein [Streptosporangiaceae bacterium]
MSARRELAIAALLCAAGAGLSASAGGREWATVHAQDTLVPLGRSLTGQELTGAATALGWAGLAGLAGLFATHGRIRAAVGVLLTVLGAGIAYASVTAVGRSHVLQAAAGKSQLLGLAGHATVDTTAWWVISAVGGLLLLAAGALVAIRGARWPGMSARYDPAGASATQAAAADRPASPGSGAADPLGMWKSLDRGEDPTAPAPPARSEQSPP